MTHSDEQSGRLIGDGPSIERRLDRIEHMLERLLAPAQEVPAIAATAVDTLDELAADLDRRGIDVDQRLRNAAALLERITAPETLAAIDKLQTLAAMIPNVLATLTDTVDDLVARAQDDGVDLDERLRALGRLVQQATEPAVLEVAEELFARIDQMKALARSGMLDPETVETLGLVARAIRDTMHEETRAIGLFGSLGALRDRRVKPAVGFAVSIAERFGEALIRRNGHDPAHQLRDRNQQPGDQP